MLPNAGRAYAAIMITVVFWASAFPLIHIALRELSPFALAAARFAVAGLVALAWVLWHRPLRPSMSDAVRLAVCGLLGVALYNVLINEGMRTVSSGAAAFIVNTSPIMTAILAYVWLRERLNIWGWAGSLIGFVGVAAIAANEPEGLVFGAGSTFILIGAFCTAVSFAIQKPLVAVHGAFAATAYMLIAAALLLSPWMPQAFTELTHAGAATWIVVIVLGVFPAWIGFVTLNYALGQLGAARASNFLYLIPPVAIVLAALMTGEQPGLLTLFGGVLAIAGVALVNWRGRA